MTWTVDSYDQITSYRIIYRKYLVSVLPLSQDYPSSSKSHKKDYPTKKENRSNDCHYFLTIIIPDRVNIKQYVFILVRVNKFKLSVVIVDSCGK